MVRRAGFINQVLFNFVILRFLTMAYNYTEYINALVTSYESGYANLIANTRSRLMPYVEMFDFEGETTNKSYAGDVSMYKDNSRFNDIKLTDFEKRTITIGRDDHYVRIPVDLNTSYDTGKDELGTAVAKAERSVPKAIDDAIAKAALGKIVLTKDGDTRSYSFTELKGKYLDATGGLTYESMVKARYILKNSGAEEDSGGRNPIWVSTGIEDEKLLQDSKLTSNDFYRIGGSEEADVNSVLGMEAITYPSYPDTPKNRILSESATYRSCFLMAPGAVKLCIAKSPDLKIIADPYKHTTMYVSLHLKIAAYRPFSERVVEVRTPLNG